MIATKFIFFSQQTEKTELRGDQNHPLMLLDHRFLAVVWPFQENIFGRLNAILWIPSITAAPLKM